MPLMVLVDGSVSETDWKPVKLDDINYLSPPDFSRPPGAALSFNVRYLTSLEQPQNLFIVLFHDDGVRPIRP